MPDWLLLLDAQLQGLGVRAGLSLMNTLGDMVQMFPGFDGTEHGICRELQACGLELTHCKLSALPCTAHSNPFSRVLAILKAGKKQQ